MKTNKLIAIYFILAIVLASMVSCEKVEPKTPNQVLKTNYTEKSQYLTYKVFRIKVNGRTTKLDSLITSNTTGDTLHHTILNTFK